MALGYDWTNVASRTVYRGQSTVNFYIDVKLNRQDVTNNYSVVDTRLRSTIHNSLSGTGYNFTLTGAAGISGSGIWYFENETILTGQTTIYHNDDGSKVGTASAYCYNSYWGISESFSGNFELPTIARASEPSISPSSTFNIGETLTIKTNRKSNTFTHDLTLTFGSYTYQIGTNIGDSVTLNTASIANSLYQQIPNANSGTGTITCVTKNGTTQVGTKSITFTAKVANSNPTFNQAYSDTNSTTTTVTQNNQHIIRNKSTLQVSITNASAKNYATLSSSKVEINGTTYTGTFSGSTSTINVGTLNLSSSITAKVSVIDSRGNTTTKDLSITILDYNTPSAIITLQRESNYYSNTSINVNAEYSSLNNKNTITIKERHKKTTDSNWSSYTTLQDDVSATLTLDNNYSWDVEVLLQDKLESHTDTVSLDRGIPLVFYDIKRRSVGINKFPQNDSSFEVDGYFETTGNAKVGGTSTFTGAATFNGAINGNSGGTFKGTNKFQNPKNIQVYDGSNWINLFVD